MVNVCKSKVCFEVYLTACVESKSLPLEFKIDRPKVSICRIIVLMNTWDPRFQDC